MFLLRREKPTDRPISAKLEKEAGLGSKKDAASAYCA